MRAAVYTRYGPPEIVRVQDVDRPVPGAGEVLVAVRAASLNPLDCSQPAGGARLVTGLRRPMVTRLGVDLAGQVVAVGENVTRFKPGDAVFGACVRDPLASSLDVWVSQGAFAEYACAPVSTLAMKPRNVTFEQAACVPVAACTALQGLRDSGWIRPGQSVLVNGAAGGVGTFAVQLARAFGTDVTGVCGTGNVDMVRSLGADQVIDYTEEDFTAAGRRYDLILDCVGNHSLADCRRALAPRGTLVMVGDRSGRGMVAILARLVASLALSRFSERKAIGLLARPDEADLAVMRDLMASGVVTPVIDRCYGLDQVPEAMRYLERRHARGKVVIVPAASRLAAGPAAA